MCFWVDPGVPGKSWQDGPSRSPFPPSSTQLAYMHVAKAGSVIFLPHPDPARISLTAGAEGVWTSRSRALGRGHLRHLGPPAQLTLVVDRVQCLGIVAPPVSLQGLVAGHDSGHSWRMSGCFDAFDSSCLPSIASGICRWEASRWPVRSS